MLFVRSSAGVAGVLGVACVVGCGSEVRRQPPGPGPATAVERLVQPATEVDVLLVVDNSPSMADKQAILSAAMPDLVAGLPAADVHLGVISSSLGALTAPQCDGASTAQPAHNERAHLLTRTASGAAPNTFEGKGFLAWTPSSSSNDKAPIADTLADMVLGVDETGCGYEMPLEAMVRFLVDPNPYESLQQSGSGQLLTNGTDQILLQQRADFLRPNSVVVVLLLSDENDCSVDVGGAGYLALGAQPFYRSTFQCASDPNDPCCTSCALASPEGCEPDPNCGAQGGSGAAKYSVTEDHPNLRCYEQKRRYGASFLYPVARYENALTSPSIDPLRPDLDPTSATAVANPLLAQRANGRVIFAGIVGVPWQALARGCPAGQSCPGAPPDLTFGLKTNAELEETNTLAQLAGDPDLNIAPAEVFMIESVDARSGTSPLTGASLPGDNVVNGRDRTIELRNGLQYACTFPLPEPVANAVLCAECTDASCDDPLCEQTTQVAAGALPGLRHVALVRAMRDEGVLGSICPQQIGVASQPSFGYRPVVDAVVARVEEELAPPCFQYALDPAADGRVSCIVIEATQASSCACDAASGRETLDEEVIDGVQAAGATGSCFCGITQLSGDELASCQNDVTPAAGADGWCYVDPEQGAGNAALTDSCPDGEERRIRFTGAGEPAMGSQTYILCTSESE